MIKPTRAFVASDGSTFSKLEDAQRHELNLLLLPSYEGRQHNEDWLPIHAADVLVNEAAKVLDILTTSSRSRPATRKINGASRKPRATTPKAPTAS
jgi:hypothetical protein